MQRTTSDYQMRLLWDNFLVFLAYFSLGALSLFFTKFSEFTSPIWLPAGLALALALFEGRRVLPGIFLGSALISPDLLQAFGNPSEILRIFYFNIPIGIGSALQAYLGALLIRRSIGWPNFLTTGDEVFKFLSLGGPVACILAPSFAVVTLILRGVVSPHDAAFEWFTWYIGDSVGVIIVAPLLVTLLSKPIEVWRGRARVMALPCLASLLLTQFAFTQIRSFDQARIKALFTEQSKMVAEEFVNELKRLDRLPLVLQAQEMGRPDARFFHQFIRPYLTLNSNVHSISWADVPHNRPVTLIEPRGKLKEILGLNLYSHSEVREALELAAKSRRPVAIPLHHFLSGDLKTNLKTKRHSIYIPYFKKDLLLGFYCVIFRSEEMISHSTAAYFANRDDFALRISEKASDSPIFAKGHPAQSKATNQIKYETDITLKNIERANWRVSILPTQSYLNNNRSVQSWTILGGGLAFSGLLSGFFLAVAGRKEILHGVTHQLRSELNEKEKKHEDIRRLEMDLAHIWRVNTMGEMASGLAHELSQPISAIGNYLQALHRLIEGESVKDPLIKESLAEISKETSRAAIFIQNLRSFIKNKKPQQSNEKINDVIHEIVSLVSGELKSNNISLELKLDASHAVVFIDRVQIGQVILNLLRNAIESMSTHEPRQLIIETVYEMPGFAKVSVTDEGCGIPQDHIDQVFEALFTTKQNGMGMGLAISKSIIEAHSGRLWVASNPGQGTTFHMTLPLA